MVVTQRRRCRLRRCLPYRNRFHTTWFLRCTNCSCIVFDKRVARRSHLQKLMKLFGRGSLNSELWIVNNCDEVLVFLTARTTLVCNFKIVGRKLDTFTYLDTHPGLHYSTRRTSAIHLGNKLCFFYSLNLERTSKNFHQIKNSLVPHRWWSPRCSRCMHDGIPSGSQSADRLHGEGWTARNRHLSSRHKKTKSTRVSKTFCVITKRAGSSFVDSISGGNAFISRFWLEQLEKMREWEFHCGKFEI